MEWYLPVIWAAVIGVAVVMYVILDGFDLGIGILFPFTHSEAERDVMMNSVAPFWDGNETWLVLGGGGLLVAFPHAYAVIMPALYLPIIGMLLALIFRGVSFEFRWRAKPRHRLWDFAFAFGSTAAAFLQGEILGGLLQGIPVDNGQFAGSALDWASPFSLVCGLAVLCGHALLGATWLNMKTSGDLQARARRLALPLLGAVLAFMAVISVWTPLMSPRIAARWFSAPDIYVLWVVPVITALVAVAVFRGLEMRRDIGPFIGVIALFLLGYIGLAISTAPYLVPPSMTFWQAAAAPASQVFMLIGTLFLLPLILIYTVFIYWVFRGKVSESTGYH